MNIEIKIDTSKAERTLRDLPEAMARARRKALMAIGAEVKSQAERTFRHPQFRPSPWAPRKNNSDPGRPLLHKSGVMKRDLAFRLVGDDTVVIGTPHEYLKFHQFGTKHMPARPVLPLDAHGNLLPRTQRKIMRIITDAVSAEIRD